MKCIRNFIYYNMSIKLKMLKKALSLKYCLVKLERIDKINKMLLKRHLNNH